MPQFQLKARLSERKEDVLKRYLCSFLGSWTFEIVVLKIENFPMNFVLVKRRGEVLAPAEEESVSWKEISFSSGNLSNHLAGENEIKQ